MPLKVRVRAKIQLTFLDYLLQELVVVRGGVQVYHPSLLSHLFIITHLRRASLLAHKNLNLVAIQLQSQR